MSLGCEARMTRNGVSVSASGLDWSPCGQRERPLRECDTNKIALGPGDNVHGAGAEALGRAGISELRTPVAAPRPRLWGPPRGNHQPGGGDASARRLGHKHWGALAGGWVPPWAEEAGGTVTESHYYGREWEGVSLCSSTWVRLGAHRLSWERTHFPRLWTRMVPKERSPSSGFRKALHSFERNMSICFKSGQLWPTIHAGWLDTQNWISLFINLNFLDYF